MRNHDGGLSALNILLLVIVIVCATLSLLTVTTSHADMALAAKQAELATGQFDCHNQAVRWLAGLQDGTLDGSGVTTRTFSDGQGHYLRVTVSPAADGYKVVEWVNSTEWNGSNGIPVVPVGK